MGNGELVVLSGAAPFIRGLAPPVESRTRGISSSKPERAMHPNYLYATHTFAFSLPQVDEIRFSFISGISPLLTYHMNQRRHAGCLCIFGLGPPAFLDGNGDGEAAR